MNMYRIKQVFGLLVTVLFLSATVAHGTDLTSTDFIIRDPIVGTGGGYSSSTNFGSYLSGDMTTIGRGTSASFEGRYGFLWYPYVTQGTFTVAASGSSANLSWGASSSGLGWNISGYKVGKATVSGGPYTYTDVGNVTSYTYSGLQPGQYCFVLQTLDAFSTVIATSPEQCVTIQPTLTFSLSANAVQFGTISASAPRYATTSGGSSTNSADAHTMTASSNVPGGYTISYEGPTLTSGTNTIAPATNISGSGTPGTEQFGLSLSTTGSATIPAGYRQSTSTWSYVANTTTPIASTSGPTAEETYGNRYIVNISSATPAGSYATNINYIITGNF